MKKYLFIILIALVAMSACNSSGDKQAAEYELSEDSLLISASENTLPDENLGIINETGFSKYARISVPDLKWDKFTNTKFWEVDSIDKTVFDPEDNYFSSYGPFLKYSPDSSKFIDLDSYNISITKNKKGQFEGSSQEPDTEISIVDIKKKEKTRLLFLGPGNSVEDAAWIDNNNLVLIGYVENENASGTNAAVWQFDLVSKRVNLYELSDSAVINKLRNYSEIERLKNVKMR